MELKTKILLRNDTKENWTTHGTVVLGKGEIGVENDTGLCKVGNGATAWCDLPYINDVQQHVHTVNSEKERDALKGMTSGDVCIVKKLIAKDKNSYSCYIYDGKSKVWQAADGEYNASNVFFDKDLVFTEPVGTVTIPGSGSKTISAAGRSISDVFAEIFAEEDAAGLKKAEPSISVSGDGMTPWVEVGTTITPKAKASFSDGQYKYGPEPTGSTASAYKITSVTTKEFVDANTATFNSYKFEQAGSYKVKAQCTASAGNAPVSNIGKEYDGQKITGGSCVSGDTPICSAYIPNFYGYINTLDKKVALSPEGLTSAVIRGLQKNQKQDANPVTSYEIKEKWAQFIYALPAGRKTKMTAKDGNNITCTVTKVGKCVVNLQGGITQEYDCFVIDNAALYGATKLQLAWN